MKMDEIQLKYDGEGTTKFFSVPISNLMKMEVNLC